MKQKEKQPEYAEEPQDGLELPDDAPVLSKAQEKALGLQPPSATAEIEWERVENKDRITLRPRRGGKRPGAGRKRKRHVRMQILVSKTTKDRIKQLAKKRGVSMSAVVSDAFEK